MIVLDTSALVRFFTNDIPKRAQKVKSVIENDNIFIPDVVFPELEYVLLGHIYNAKKLDVLKAFQFLANKKNIKTSKELIKALEIYKNNNLDIADCLIVAYTKNRKLLSFDDKMVKVAKDLEK